MRQFRVETGFRVGLPRLVHDIGQLLALQLAVEQKIQQIFFRVVQGCNRRIASVVIHNHASQIVDLLRRSCKCAVHASYLFEQRLQGAETFAHQLLEIQRDFQNLRDLFLKFGDVFFHEIHLILPIEFTAFFINQTPLQLLIFGNFIQSGAKKIDLFGDQKHRLTQEPNGLNETRPISPYASQIAFIVIGERVLLNCCQIRIGLQIFLASFRRKFPDSVTDLREQAVILDFVRVQQAEHGLVFAHQFFHHRKPVFGAQFLPGCFRARFRHGARRRRRFPAQPPIQKAGRRWRRRQRFVIFFFDLLGAFALLNHLLPFADAPLHVRETLRRQDRQRVLPFVNRDCLCHRPSCQSRPAQEASQTPPAPGVPFVPLSFL